MMRLLVGMATVLVLAACGARPGSARVTLTFENETQTRCVRVSARAPNGANLNAVPTALDRTDDQLVVGIAETAELVGELDVTVARFREAGCTGTPFATETRSVVLTSGQESSLEFVFRGEGATDGGSDGGTPDGGGPDAGCEVASCPAPGECQVQALACLAPGSCTYEAKTPGTACGDGGVCGGGTCAADPCSVTPTGGSCDDNLPCTTASACNAGVCRATQCAMTPPACQRIRQPVIACDATTPSFCQLEADPAQDNSACMGGSGLCRSGECRPWLPSGLSPRFFDLTITQVPYPTDVWALASPDGGRCAVVLNTGPADPPFVEDGGCGLPPLTTRVAGDGGIALFTMTGLIVPATVEVHFTGTRPAQLLVLGDATIDGLVSVAPQLVGARPAGAHPVSCLDAGVGNANKEAGGGGAFGAAGGVGGANGGLGGTAAPSASVLRGGCGGANGFDSNGNAVGGIGGGAIDLIVSGTLTVRNGGAVTASGGGGGAPAGDNRGGGGGGSGGMVVLEADVLRVLDGGAVTANGGGGGEGGKNSETSAPGPFGSFTSNQRVANPGTSANGGNGGRGGAGAGVDASGEDGGAPGGTGNPGGGGGGGSVGVIYLKARTSCTATSTGGVLSGAQPEAIGCP